MSKTTQEKKAKKGQLAVEDQKLDQKAQELTPETTETPVTTEAVEGTESPSRKNLLVRPKNVAKSITHPNRWSTFPNTILSRTL